MGYILAAIWALALATWALSGFLSWLWHRTPKKPQRLTCPYCGGTGWYEGPRGGLSTNIMCANPDCEHWFNYHEGIIPMEDLHMVGLPGSKRKTGREE